MQAYTYKRVRVCGLTRTSLAGCPHSKK